MISLKHVALALWTNDRQVSLSSLGGEGDEFGGETDNVVGTSSSEDVTRG